MEMGGEGEAGCLQDLVEIIRMVEAETNKILEPETHMQILLTQFRKQFKNRKMMKKNR
jgi:hypothetical protein